MPNIVNHSGLKNILRLDAATCAAVAALQLALPQALSQWLGLAVPLLLGSAVFLLAYVGLLLVMARTAQLWPWVLQLVVWGNAGWGIGCLALAFAASGVTGLGVAYLLLQALTVFAIAAWQWRMARRGQAPFSALQQA
jgi:hypothetical protein